MLGCRSVRGIAGVVAWAVTGLVSAAIWAGGAPTDLAGTSWRLLRIQSMDDRVFTPADPDDYTLTFAADGKLQVRADCNRGVSTWTREGSSGLTFGPIAATRAMCPPESLHDRFLSDLGYVRSFVSREGHLFLATMADGAILEFEPVPPTASAPAFDCARAEGSVQELICADAGLAELDRELDAVYRRALDRFPEAEIDTLEAVQRGWIKGRDDCWKEQDPRACVEREYGVRITELQIATGAFTVPAPVELVCSDGVGLTAVFYSDTALPAAVLTRTPGEQVIAYRAPSASGAKYEGRNVTFWTKGDEATLTWMGETSRCEKAGTE